MPFSSAILEVSARKQRETAAKRTGKSLLGNCLLERNPPMAISAVPDKHTSDSCNFSSNLNTFAGIKKYALNYKLIENI